MQVRLAYGEKVGGAVIEMSAAAQGHFGCSEGCLESLLVRVAVTKPEVEHGTQCSGTVGGECACIECNLPYEVGVDDAYRAARRALRGEMIDVRYLDAVHVETVFGR